MRSKASSTSLLALRCVVEPLLTRTHLRQVESIGVVLGYLPKPKNGSEDFVTPGDGKISNPSLLAALENKADWERAGISATNRAIAAYEAGGRRRFALRLHAVLARDPPLPLLVRHQVFSLRCHTPH